MNRVTSVLFAAAAIVTGISSSSAAMVYEVNFDGANGSDVSNVTGGTATLNGGATVSGGYLKLGPPGITGVMITPAGAASSLNSWSSLNGRAINGGMDFFFRPNSDMTACRFMDTEGGQANSLNLSFGSGWSAALLAEPLGNIGTYNGVYNSSSGRVGNNTATPLLSGRTYHAGLTFSTVADVVTAKLFIVEGNVDIDTSSTTGLTGIATYTVSADNAGFTTNAFLFGDTNNGVNTPSSPDFDAIRIYNAAETSFPALVPEPTTMALLGLIPLGLLRRRRAHSL